MDPTATPPPIRYCERCDGVLSPAAKTCKHCRDYGEATIAFWKNRRAEGRKQFLDQLEGYARLFQTVRWCTAGDTHVCKLCRKLNSKVFTIDQARAIILDPRHCATKDPADGCRCLVLPVRESR